MSIAEEVEVDFVFSHLSGSVPNVKKVIKYNGYYYHNILRLPFTREEDNLWMKRNGRYTKKTATELMLKIRESHCNSFSGVYDDFFILIGRTLYQRWCKVKDLSVTTCGNMIFGQWFSVDIESTHHGKANTLFNKKNYYKILDKAKKYFNKSKTKGREKEQYFSFPKSLKWGKTFV